MHFSHSLKDSSRFRKLYHNGRSAVGRYMVIYCKPNRSEENRIGYTVSKKLGHAVVRNRVRRRLREIYRLHETKFQPGLDLVVVARTAAVHTTYAKLEESFLELAGKLGLIRAESSGE